MKYIIPVGMNMGHSNFIHWLEKIHPQGFNVCWDALELMCWDTWTSPVDKCFESKPSIDDIWNQYYNVDQESIRNTLGFESFIDPDKHELYLIVPDILLNNFIWEKYPSPVKD